MRRIVKAGKGKVVISAKQFEDMAGITYPFLLTTTPTYLKAHPDVVQKVVNAYAKADKYISDHHEERSRSIRPRSSAAAASWARMTSASCCSTSTATPAPASPRPTWKDLPATRDYPDQDRQAQIELDLDKIIEQSYGKKAEAAAEIAARRSEREVSKAVMA